MLSTNIITEVTRVTLCTPTDVQILAQTMSSTSTRSLNCNKTWSFAKEVQVPTVHRTGSFFVGAETFYAQEMQTINNNNTSLALQRLDVHVYDLTGSPASISTAFCFVLRIIKRVPSLKKQLY
jgi:hypothetical protein